jgi:phosphonate transport system ATP-binding protein
MEILQRVNREDGITVLVSLHQVDIALRYCRRIVALRAGEIVFDGKPEALTAAMLAEIYEGDTVGLPELPRPRAAARSESSPSLVHA